jgi:preprotein translocase subunit SecG
LTTLSSIRSAFDDKANSSGNKNKTGNKTVRSPEAIKGDKDMMTRQSALLAAIFALVSLSFACGGYLIADVRTRAFGY